MKRWPALWAALGLPLLSSSWRAPIVARPGKADPATPIADVLDFLQRDRDEQPWLVGAANHVAPTPRPVVSGPPPMWRPWESTTLPSSTVTWTTTIPPCHWIHDRDGVARPAECQRLADGNITCYAANYSFPVNSSHLNCTPPILRDCPSMNLGVLNTADYTMSRTGLRTGDSITIACADAAVPFNASQPVDSWGESWYQGPRSQTTHCNNGTWTNVEQVGSSHGTIAGKPLSLVCTTREQIGLLKEMEHLHRWTLEKLNETEIIDFKWIDSTALLRKNTLKTAQEHANRTLKEIMADHEIPSKGDFQIIIDALKANSIIPRGEPPSEETCKDFGNHFLWQNDPGPHQLHIGGNSYGFSNNATGQLVQPVGFACRYAAQRTPTGFDPITRQATFYFRDGCYCESQWKNLCPYQLGSSYSVESAGVTYQNFGFAALNEKPIAPAAGSLCWYWSDAAHPEWGYLRNSHGYAYQAPAKNGDDLMGEWVRLNEEATAAREAAEAERRRLLQSR